MTALVLSGGGPLAVAWETGMLAGLAEAGALLSEVDFILGTSAGAIVGAQIAGGRSPIDMAAAIRAEANGIPPPGAARFAPAALARLPEYFAMAQSRPDDPAAARRAVGAHALAAEGESEADTLARFRLILGTDEWPTRDFGSVVVDAEDGSVRVLTRGCGGSLAQAVAASCSLPGISRPIEIGARRYIDGGFASTVNADLAAGHGRLIVLAFRPPGPSGERIEERLNRQVAALRDSGATLFVVQPDAVSLHAIGLQSMDVRRRPEVVSAALDQGCAAANDLLAFLA